jgi:hypothetical protein
LSFNVGPLLVKVGQSTRILSMIVGQKRPMLSSPSV